MRARRLLLALSLAIAGESIAQVEDIASAAADRNAVIAADITVEADFLANARAELTRVGALRDDLDARVGRIDRRADLHAGGRRFAELLRSELRALPRPERIDALQRGLERRTEAANDASIAAEAALRELDDLEAALERRLEAASVPPGDPRRAQAGAELRKVLLERQALLGRLNTLRWERLQVLSGIAEALASLARRADDARGRLTARLYWLPSPPGRELLAEFGAVPAWLASGERWRTAGSTLAQSASGNPVLPVVALVAATLLLAARPGMLRRLASLGEAVARGARHGIGVTLGAIAITLLLAAPVPLLLWTAGTMLREAPASMGFALALGEALVVASRLLFGLSSFSWLLHPAGVAAGHFGWDADAVRESGRTLRRFAVIFVPLMFVTVLNGLDHAPYDVREGLGRLAFCAAMVLVAMLLVRLFGRSSPAMRRLTDRAPRGWLVRLHGAWLVALVAIPIGVMSLALGGYFTAAGHLFGRMMITLLVALGAALLYGIAALWVQVQRARLGADGAASSPADAVAATPLDQDGAKAQPVRVNLAELGEQTRSLLDFALTLLLLAGLWWVWRDALPALSTISDYALIPPGVDGAAGLTVGRLFVALVVGLVSVVAVRDVGAILDMLLLQRFDFRPDATYAIKVLARYAIAAIGVVLGARILGIAWGNVQWLVAAMGVGLGFGLQEIVANFVSGLIVLAERPVRIGDVVTIGDVTGTVSRIRARSTVVVDFENKEVMVPNKAFITDRVVNWTLSDPTTRLLLPFGVAYGSDVALVQRVVLDAVRANGDVLRQPASSVYFAGFGDSSLDFEVRAYVSAFDKRIRVRHELNVAIERVLRDHGVEIPFPQRDLHIRSVSGPTAFRWGQAEGGEAGTR